MNAEEVVTKLIQEVLSVEEQQALDPLLRLLKPRLRARVEQHFYQRCRSIPTPDYRLCFGLALDTDDYGNTRLCRLVVRSRCHVLNPALKEYAVYFEDTVPDTSPRPLLGAPATQHISSSGWCVDPDEARIQFLEDNLFRVRMPHSYWLIIHGYHSPESLECWAFAMLEQELNQPGQTGYRERWFGLNGDEDLLAAMEPIDASYLDESEARRRLLFTPEDWMTTPVDGSLSSSDTFPILLFDPSLAPIMAELVKEAAKDRDSSFIQDRRDKRESAYRRFYQLHRRAQLTAQQENRLVRYRCARFNTTAEDKAHDVRTVGRLNVDSMAFEAVTLTPDALQELQRAVRTPYTPELDGLMRWFVDPMTFAGAIRRDTVAVSKPWMLCWPLPPEATEAPRHDTRPRYKARGRRLREKDTNLSALASPVHDEGLHGHCCRSCALNLPCESTCPAQDETCSVPLSGGCYVL